MPLLECDEEIFKQQLDWKIDVRKELRFPLYKI